MTTPLTRRSLLLAALAPSVALAKFPPELGAVLVEAPSMFGDRVFDLNPALSLAASQNKPVFIYFGANDCPPCRQFSDFLRSNAASLAPSFSAVVPVEIRTWLQGGPISFKGHEKTYSAKAWLKKMGASSTGLRYPSFWLVTPDLSPITQITADLSEVTNVGKFIEILARK